MNEVFQLSTPLGKVQIEWSRDPAVIRQIILPISKKKIAEGNDLRFAQPNDLPDWMASTVQSFGLYFSGRPVDFSPDNLDFDQFSKFYGIVYRKAFRIPWGSTRSYAELAQEAGSPRAARAVGSAMARNPYSIMIPCHRVLTSGGGLGGYGGGLSAKQYLLELEGILQAV